MHFDAMLPDLLQTECSGLENGGQEREGRRVPPLDDGQQWPNGQSVRQRKSGHTGRAGGGAPFGASTRSPWRGGLRLGAARSLREAPGGSEVVKR